MTDRVFLSEQDAGLSYVRPFWTNTLTSTSWAWDYTAEAYVLVCCDANELPAPYTQQVFRAVASENLYGWPGLAMPLMSEDTVYTSLTSQSAVGLIGFLGGVTGAASGFTSAIESPMDLMATAHKGLYQLGCVLVYSYETGPQYVWTLGQVTASGGVTPVVSHYIDGMNNAQASFIEQDADGTWYVGIGVEDGVTFYNVVYSCDLAGNILWERTYSSPSHELQGMSVSATELAIATWDSVDGSTDFLRLNKTTGALISSTHYVSPLNVFRRTLYSDADDNFFLCGEEVDGGTSCLVVTKIVAGSVAWGVKVPFVNGTNDSHYWSVQAANSQYIYGYSDEYLGAPVFALSSVDGSHAFSFKIQPALPEIDYMQMRSIGANEKGVAIGIQMYENSVTHEDIFMFKLPPSGWTATDYGIFALEATAAVTVSPHVITPSAVTGVFATTASLSEYALRTLSVTEALVVTELT